MDNDFYILSNKYLINKYIENLPILYYNKLSKNKTHLITKSNLSIPLGILSFLDEKINYLV